MSATSGVEGVVWQEIKCHIFVSQSTTTHMTSYPSNHHSHVMKSIEMQVQGFDGTEGSQDSCWSLSGGLTSLASVTIADVPDYFLAHSKPDEFLGNDFKGLSLTIVA
jgi:hypothetical protein